MPRLVSWLSLTQSRRQCRAKENIGRYQRIFILRWHRVPLCFPTHSTKRKQRNFWNSSRRKKQGNCSESLDLPYWASSKTVLIGFDGSRRAVAPERIWQSTGKH